MTEAESTQAAKRYNKASRRVLMWRDVVLPRTVSARQRMFALKRIARWQSARSVAAHRIDGKDLPDRMRCAVVAWLIAETDRALLRGDIWQTPEIDLVAVPGVSHLLRLLAAEPDVWYRADLVRRLGMTLGPDPGSRPVDDETCTPLVAWFTLQLAMSLYRAAGLHRDEAWRLVFEPERRS
ncbi:hypothetical protein [Amycolatopsis sp. NPDC059657]|uniref:hypothetical protein n=1 Tax=Amycolatopsis sp. NPDC059657 TaxID=3346899 RepID=UPI00366F9AD4